MENILKVFLMAFPEWLACIFIPAIVIDYSTTRFRAVNQQIFGGDSTQTISRENLLAGFVAGVVGSGYGIKKNPPLIAVENSPVGIACTASRGRFKTTSAV